MSDYFKFSHPLLLCDVEPLNREECCDMREELSQSCRSLWKIDAFGEGEETIPLPDPAGGEGKGIRLLLREAQYQDPKIKKLIYLKKAANDPAYARSRKTKESKEPVRISNLYTDNFRLAPTDGVLEYQQVYATWVAWVPVCPNARLELGEGSMTWKEWMFQMAHGTEVMSNHRTANETAQILKRMTFWEGMGPDCDKYYRSCQVCLKYRSHAVQGPYRSILADPSNLHVLPWQDVIIDIQGPFTKAGGGEQYVLAYHCTKLKVPILVPLKTLTTANFSQALATALFRSRTVPDIIRTDRGPEMMNKVNTEFGAILGMSQYYGAALTPRHQGMGERGHQTMLTSLLILMKEVVNAFPQEWANLVPAVEHLMHTAPQGSHGISAHDLSCAWGIACSRDTQLAPFQVPAGTPETDVASGLFSNFRELMGVFTRYSVDAALRTQLAENKTRVERTFESGEIVSQAPSGGEGQQALIPGACPRTV